MAPRAALVTGVSATKQPFVQSSTDSRRILIRMVSSQLGQAHSNSGFRKIKCRAETLGAHIVVLNGHRSCWGVRLKC